MYMSLLHTFQIFKFYKYSLSDRLYENSITYRNSYKRASTDL